MIVKCPFCGDRDSSEFYMRGEAAPPRPCYEQGEQAFADYVYWRENAAGPQEEHWYHSAACRNWLIVTRDTRNHEILSVKLAVGSKI